jgi:AcrR family transcriptional regulator
MARRSPRVIDTKQRILDAALSLFSRRGYHGVTVDKIAAHAKVTKGAVYYYFTDAADIARDLARQIWDRVEAEARRALVREQDTSTNLKRGFDAFLNGLLNLPEARFLLRDCRAIAELNSSADEARAGSVALVRAMLESGMARGEIAPLDADALAHVLMGACAEATLHAVETGGGAAVDVIHRLIDGLALPRTRAGVKAVPRRRTTR